MIKPPALSNTARAILLAAAQRDNHRALPPERLPVAAQRAVARSMLNAGLLELVPAKDDEPGWHTAEGGERQALRATEIGLAAVVAETMVAQAAPTGPNHDADKPAVLEHAAQVSAVHDTAALRPAHLRAAAVALLVTWDDAADDRPALCTAIEALRAALHPPKTRRRPAQDGSKPPRTDIKQSVLLALLRRPEGASGPQMADATGWAPHTVRGFLAGLQKRGISVTVLERVRQVGPGKEGAKGSYTVYHVAEAG